MGARFPAVGEEIYQNGKGKGRNNSDVLYWNRRHWCELLEREIAIQRDTVM